LKIYVRLVFVAGIVVAGLILANFHSTVMGAQGPDGKAIFLVNCAVCHQATGLGGGPYPPLAGNPDVNRVDSYYIIQTLLNGRTGPITVNGKTFNDQMPTWKGQLT
jgi:mono/diheme cytochrome c family protein